MAVESWQPKNNFWLPLFIISLSLILRILCLSHHLPDLAHIEEAWVTRTAMSISLSDLNPHTFIYPALLYYILALIFNFFHLLTHGKLIYFDQISMNIIIGRAFTVISGVLSIFILYLIGKKLFNSRIGLISALFLAFSPLHVYLSYTLKPDMLMFLLILVSFLFICNLYFKRGIKFSNYFFAALFIALAVSTKYNAIFLIFPFFAAHFLRFNNDSRLTNKNIFLALIIFVLVFFLLNPFILRDSENFIRDMRSELLTINSGFIRKPLHIQRGWIIYPLASVSVLGPAIFILSLSGLISSLVKLSKKDILLLSFPLMYYIGMGYSRNSPSYYMLPFIPFLLLYAARSVVAIIEKVFQLGIIKNIRRGLILLLCAILLPSFHSVFVHSRWISQKDTRIFAKDWIYANIPEGAKILMDGVSDDAPFIFSKTKTPYRISVIKWREQIGHRQLFEENNFDFIIICDINNRPQNLKMLYDFIDDNFILVKEIKPFIDNPITSFSIYNKVYNPCIRIYDCRQKKR